MTMTSMARILTYSGTVPLIVMAVLVYIPTLSDAARFIASTYSAIIISFLCGIHWALFIFFAERCPRHLLLTSNALALFAWASLLWRISLYTLLAQAFCFLYLLYLDKRINEAGLYPVWFYRLRCEASVIVMISLMVIAGSFVI